MFAIDEELPLGEIGAMIAKPFSPGNAFPAEDVARERITFDKAMIGSCTNGSYDDLLSAALVLVAARGKGLTKAAKEFVVFPGSGGVKRQIEQPEPRLGGESIADVFRAVGGEIRELVVWPVLRPGRRRARERPARDHLVQPQLAEPHGPRRRRLSRESFGRCRLGAGRLHGAAERTRDRLGPRHVRSVKGSPLSRRAGLLRSRAPVAPLGAQGSRRVASLASGFVCTSQPCSRSEPCSRRRPRALRPSAAMGALWRPLRNRSGRPVPPAASSR